MLWCLTTMAIAWTNDKLLSTHWGRVTHICIGKLTIIGSDNGLSPGWHQAIICNNAGILLIGPLATKFSEILIRVQTFSFKKMHMKMSAKWRPFCLDLNVLIGHNGTNSLWTFDHNTNTSYHENLCNYALYIFLEILLGWMLTIPFQHQFR